MTTSRELLSFSIVAMAPREAILLKSFIRILDGRTVQRWLFKAQQDQHEQQEADLTFFGDGGEGGSLVPDALAANALPANSSAAMKLRMGALSLGVYAALDRPLRPELLERELNRIGSLLVQVRGAPVVTPAVDFDILESDLKLRPELTSHPGSRSGSYSSTEAGLDKAGVVANAQPQHSALLRPLAALTPDACIPSPAVLTAPAGSMATVAVNAALPQTGNTATAQALPAVVAYVILDDEDDLRLLRWPAASLINTPARLKLAAFMTGSTITLGKLQKNSGQTLAACTAFVRDLHVNGFIAVAPQPSKPIAAPPRMEETKAFEAATHQAKSDITALTDPSKKPRGAPAAPGLFARIRARLGLPQSS